MKKYGFTKFWIIIAAAILLVALFITAWFITLEATEKDMLTRYNQQQFLVVAGTAIGIEGLFDDLSASLGALAQQPDIQYFHQSHTRSALTQKLDELKSQGITDIGILDANGTATTFAVKTEAGGIDYSWQATFKATQENDLSAGSNSLIIELQTASPADLVLKVALPIFETAMDARHPDPSGKYLGAIVADLTLDTLVQRHIAPFKPPGDGHIFLVNDQYDIIWSSDHDMIMTSILNDQQGALAPLANQMAAWVTGASAGGFYQFASSSDRGDLVLIAFAPVDLGQEILAVAVITPDVVVRQTSLANFQRQQLVFIISVLTILIGVIVGGLVMGREVSRRFRVENALKKSAMEQAIITERNRLASDLHDSVTQGLYGIVLHAVAASGRLSTGQTAKVKSYLDAIKTAAKEGLTEMRLLIFELRPPVLEKEGLAAALQVRLFAVEKRAGLMAEFQASGDGRLPLEIEDALYRIAGEVLNNTLKHAHAQHIAVHLHQGEHRVMLDIEDDGCGFDLSSAQASGGTGLSIIATRVSKIGGTLSIQSQPNSGTRVIVEVKI